MTAISEQRPTAPPEPATARQAAPPATAGQAAQEDLRALFGQSTAVFAALAGPGHLVETANPAFFAAFGEGRARTGVPLAGQVKHTQRLMAEHRALLEQIARQAPLAAVLDGMARSIEHLAPQEVLVSVLLADPDGRHLRHGAAPSLPDFYNEAIDGIATGEGVGSCVGLPRPRRGGPHQRADDIHRHRGARRSGRLSESLTDTGVRGSQSAMAHRR
jgi:hypothetical protein